MKVSHSMQKKITYNCFHHYMFILWFLPLKVILRVHSHKLHIKVKCSITILNKSVSFILYIDIFWILCDNFSKKPNYMILILSSGNNVLYSRLTDCLKLVLISDLKKSPHKRITTKIPQNLHIWQSVTSYVQFAIQSKTSTLLQCLDDPIVTNTVLIDRLRYLLAPQQV